MNVIKALEELLEPLSETQYNELLTSIQNQGQQVQITTGYLLDNPGELFIVDGHNRYRACLKLGVEPLVSKPIKYTSMAQVKLAMIDINNLRRRKLTKFEIKETLKKLYVSGELNSHGGHNAKQVPKKHLLTLNELAIELGASKSTIRKELARIKAADEIANSGIIGNQGDNGILKTLESMGDAQFAAAVSGISDIQNSTNTDELDQAIDKLAKSTPFTSEEISKFAEMRQQNTEFREQMKEARQLQQEIRIKKRIESATNGIIVLLDGYGEEEVIKAVLSNVIQHYRVIN